MEKKTRVKLVLKPVHQSASRKNSATSAGGWPWASQPNAVRTAVSHPERSTALMIEKIFDRILSLCHTSS
eukprot:9600824-Alexandrium_andersonii.AAC.1